MSAEAAPYAVKRTKVVALIESAPPPRPPCFGSDAQWKEYLLYAHASGEQITRRQDLGKWGARTGRGARVVQTVFAREIDYCQDCDRDYHQQMRARGTCHRTEPPTPPDAMLKRLSSLLRQLQRAVDGAQLGMVPTPGGGMTILVAWMHEGNQHEVAQSFSASEIAEATDEQIADAAAVLVASVWEQVAAARSANDADARLKLAAREAPQRGNTLAEALLGPANG